LLNPANSPCNPGDRIEILSELRRALHHTGYLKTNPNLLDFMNNSYRADKEFSCPPGALKHA